MRRPAPHCDDSRDDRRAVRQRSQGLSFAPVPILVRKRKLLQAGKWWWWGGASSLLDGERRSPQRCVVTPNGVSGGRVTMVRQAWSVALVSGGAFGSTAAATKLQRRLVADAMSSAASHSVNAL